MTTTSTRNPARQPAEWSPHAWVWIGFPSHPGLWEENLEPARDEVIAFAQAVHAGGRGEQVRLVAADEESAIVARRMAGDGIVVLVEPFGDIWLRDTAPILLDGDGRIVARQFRFNGWGGKYDLPYDDSVGRRLAAAAGLASEPCDWVFEGGALDVDGAGMAVTTEQCLLNPNRNPGVDRAEAEARLARDLGIRSVLWLGDGLLNDHTDGHVDNLARFVAPGVLALPAPEGPHDPNAAIFADARARAEAFGLAVATIPSPGAVVRDGEIVPASYMNFYIGNAAVVVPTYGADNDSAALAAIAALFPTRMTIGLRADHILTGGGSFHCISQQAPALPLA